MSSINDPAASRPKHRSPIYPAFDLATALDRTAQLWQHAGRHYVPMADAMRVWGYSPKSSGGLQTVAAMKRFGLLDDEGSANRRQVRVSDLGRTIVTDEPGSVERATRIKQAALLPKIHRELWEEHAGSLPPDSTLRFKLVNDRAFSESAARDLIEEFRKTLDFAGLTEEDGMVSSGYQDNEETNITKAPPTAPTRPSPMGPVAQPVAGFQLPVGPGEFALLQGPFPITDDQWNLMLSVLQAMKPGLVAQRSASMAEDEE